MSRYGIQQSAWKRSFGTIRSWPSSIDIHDGHKLPLVNASYRVAHGPGSSITGRPQSVGPRYGADAGLRTRLNRCIENGELFVGSKTCNQPDPAKAHRPMCCIAILE